MKRIIDVEKYVMKATFKYLSPKSQQLNLSTCCMFLQIQLDIGAQSLPGSQNGTNCFRLAPVRPAANARNRQKSKRQQINASKSDWICENIPRAQNTQLNDKCPWTPSPPRCFGHSTTLHPQALSPVAELPQCTSLAVNHARQPAEKISFPGNGINNYLRPHSEYKISVQTLPSPLAVL